MGRMMVVLSLARVSYLRRQVSHRGIPQSWPSSFTDRKVNREGTDFWGPAATGILKLR